MIGKLLFTEKLFKATTNILVSENLLRIYKNGN
jgi:hypothetical protein